MVCYTGSNPKVKLQITTPDDNTYTYLLSQDQEYETFPLPGGDGSYSLTVLENVEGDMYSIACSQEIEASLADEFLPFLYPNQYVNFTPESRAVEKGAELVKNAHSDLEAVTSIYHYIISNITYDTDKAASVAYGYLPDVDDTLSSKTGICLTMRRSRQPCCVLRESLQGWKSAMPGKPIMHGSASIWKRPGGSTIL